RKRKENRKAKGKRQKARMKTGNDATTAAAFLGAWASRTPRRAFCLLPSAFCLLLSAFCLLLSCGPPRADRIVVGSKNFTEQAVLGELITQHLESKTGLPVERRFYLAGSYICHQAILGGRIDLYPEYTGTALTAILKETPQGSAADVYKRVQEEYLRRFGLAVTAPLGFDNTFAIVIRGQDARRLRLHTI